jgi:hypothetical protein
MSGLVLPNGKPANVHKAEGDGVPKFEDLTPEQQEALGTKAEENGVDGANQVTTAYYVVVDRDGTVSIVPDLSVKFVADRLPTAEDILGSASVVQASIAAQITASHTQQVMMAQARAMAQAQAQQQAVQQMQGMNLRS